MRIHCENHIYEAEFATFLNGTFRFVTKAGDHYSIEVDENSMAFDQARLCLVEHGFIDLDRIAKRDVSTSKLMKIGEGKK